MRESLIYTYYLFKLVWLFEEDRLEFNRNFNNPYKSYLTFSVQQSLTRQKELSNINFVDIS